MRRAQAAYTLIEILIVLLIISIVSGAMLLTVGRSYRTLQTFQNEFVQVLSFAQETAILQPVILMAQFNSQTIQFFQYSNNSWVPTRHSQLDNIIIPADIQLNIEVLAKEKEQETEEDDEEKPARLVFSPNGQITPFKLYIGKRNEKPQYLITNTIDGSLVSKELP